MFAFSSVWSSLIVYGSCIFALCVIQVSMLRPREGYGLRRDIEPQTAIFFKPREGCFITFELFSHPRGSEFDQKVIEKFKCRTYASTDPSPALAPSVQTLITAGVFCISCVKLCLQFWRQFFIVFRWSSLQFKSIFCPLPALVFRLYFSIVFPASPRFARFALILFTRIVKNSRVNGAYHFHKPPGWKCYA